MLQIIITPLWLNCQLQSGLQGVGFSGALVFWEIIKMIPTLMSTPSLAASPSSQRQEVNRKSTRREQQVHLRMAC